MLMKGLKAISFLAGRGVAGPVRKRIADGVVRVVCELSSDFRGRGSLRSCFRRFLNLPVLAQADRNGLFNDPARRYNRRG